MYNTIDGLLLLSPDVSWLKVATLTCIMKVSGIITHSTVQYSVRILSLQFTSFYEQITIFRSNIAFYKKTVILMKSFNACSDACSSVCGGAPMRCINAATRCSRCTMYAQSSPVTRLTIWSINFYLNISQSAIHYCYCMEEEYTLVGNLDY